MPVGAPTQVPLFLSVQSECREPKNASTESFKDEGLVHFLTFDIGETKLYHIVYALHLLRFTFYYCTGDYQ